LDARGATSESDADGCSVIVSQVTIGIVMKYKLTIEYFGTEFVGWQKQNNGISVQAVIENAIMELTKQQVVLHAAGRTDAGVHALAQIAHFDMDDFYDTHKFMMSINHFVRPHKISIISCEIADDNFHARFSAKKRHYKYIILNRLSPSVIYENRVWHVVPNLDIKNMKKASGYLIGQHDFTSFRARECQAQSPIKTLDKIDIEREGDLIIFHFSATSFLHHMVRNIIGTLKAVGEGKIKPEEVKAMLDAKDRSAAGVTSPPDGLYFLKVDYD
jgi:tRNA pseudouridine38-40 synthase